MRRHARSLSVLCAALLAVAGAQRVIAQNPPQDHAGQYAMTDIVFGAQLYAAQCVNCHGANGDGVGGVNLRSGPIRRASHRPRAAAARHERHPGHGDAGVQLHHRRTGRHRGLHPEHERARHRVGEAGRCDPGTDDRRRQGRVPEVPRDQRQGLGGRARPERHRRQPRAEHARTAPDRSRARR